MPVFFKETGSGFIHAFHWSGKSHRRGSRALRGGVARDLYFGSSGRDRIGFQGIPGIMTELSPGTSAGDLGASLLGVPGVSGLHPLPSRAHTYLGPDTVCGSEAGGLWRKEGGGRRKAGRECPGAWPGRRRKLQLLAGHACPAPLHTPCRRVGRQPVPFPGPPACSLLPARAVLGLGASQCAGGRQPCPQLHLPPS